MLDLSFRISDLTAHARELTLLPADLTALMIGINARQADSTTARVQMILDTPPIAPDRFAPIEGSFNAAVARALSRWKHDTPRQSR